ncbi:hypothetical protein TYRP_005936 [Tyrophagus putrescentiae]|nr:hypothetical protein TYRP_005936 [Tyrophagus putrescentiae]
MATTTSSTSIKEMMGLLGLVSVALVLSLVGLAQCGIIDDANSALNALACPLQHTKKYDTCTSVVNPLYTVQPKVLGDERKGRCCSSLARRDCTKAIAYLWCGSESNPAEVVVDVAKALNVDCINGTDGLTDCLHPVALIIIIVLFLCIIFTLIKCICSCLCCRRQK